MIIVDNRYPFLTSQGKVLGKKKAKYRPLYCPTSRWGYLVERQDSKVIVCLSNGVQITDESKYWSGEQIVR